MPGVHISLKAEKVFELFGFPVTNSILATWAVMLLLTVGAWLVTKNLKLRPGKLQVAVESIIEMIYNLFVTINGDKTLLFFPLIATLLLFIMFLNWFGLVPGVGSIGINEIEEGHKVFVPLFRAGTADLNTTLAFALISVITIQVVGIKTLGKEYVGRFFNTKSPIYFFAGILELMGEGTKVISFAFRLFGNVFAGEVLLTVIAFLLPVIAPLPFIAMELFVGFIQALVFSMLTAVFLSLASTSHEH